LSEYGYKAQEYAVACVRALTEKEAEFDDYTGLPNRIFCKILFEFAKLRWNTNCREGSRWKSYVLWGSMCRWGEENWMPMPADA
jgi:hypothetical protein